MSDPLLFTQAVTWSPMPGESERLDDLQIRNGDHLAITGPNGSGKSRLIEILAGFKNPLKGSVILGTHRTSMIRERPEAQLIFHQVERELVFPLENIGLSHLEIQEMLQVIVQVFGLQDMLFRDPFLLSGGQEQLLILAVASISRPDIYFIDQPLDYLDQRTSVFFCNWLEKERSRGAALVTASDDQPLTSSASQLIRLTSEPVRSRDSIPQITMKEKFPEISFGCRQLVCGYSGSTPLFAPLTRHFSSGDRILISGAMGTGKSTLALTLAGLIPPVSGDVLLNGKPLHFRVPRSFYSEGITCAFQYPESQLAMDTIRDEIGIYNSDSLLYRVKLLLPLLGLSETIIDLNLRSLPNSSVRLLSLLIILALDKPVSILDEPFVGLDEVRSRNLLNLLRTMNHVLIVIDHTGHAQQLQIDQEIVLPDHS